MALQLWKQTRMTKAGQRRLKKIYILALQRLLNPRYAKAFAMYAGNRALQGNIDYSFENVLLHVKRSTLEKYSQPILISSLAKGGGFKEVEDQIKFIMVDSLTFSYNVLQDCISESWWESQMSKTEGK